MSSTLYRRIYNLTVDIQSRNRNFSFIRSYVFILFLLNYYVSKIRTRQGKSNFYLLLYILLQKIKVLTTLDSKFCTSECNLIIIITHGLISSNRFMPFSVLPFAKLNYMVRNNRENYDYLCMYFLYLIGRRIVCTTYL
jgi:hypothetical protein